MAYSSHPSIAPLPEAEELDIRVLKDSLIAGDCDLVVVLGPTASGKTAFAVRLARELSPAEILSADSRQVYRGMDIGTGKDLEEYGDIPYHLIDIAPAGSQYNVHDYTVDFVAAYSEIVGRRASPILCGGTGLYINAVTAGYDFRTSKPLSETGLSHSSRPAGLPLKPFFIGTLVSREERNRRIDARLESRLREGMIEEIRGLLDSGVSAEVLISYGLEYRFVTRYIQGELSYDEMFTGLSTAIHQFAKRQMTWFRGMERSGVRIHWVRI